ncbi:MAG: Amidophosphoribosyltransferase-like protein [Candidatus Moranbacteria bacterium GW2011_GWE1_35_17]|nr:MAG: Amidophosphoribosyltransferase-like protein [Candidatus Moranbacteria bacterium GW2011_GWE1_35_17]KKP82072.1 MAG: Amidophosphoribosyltransferase-like protein [Candidatus Moranbacteria bacterium GW2011_GWF1_35_5]
MGIIKFILDIIFPIYCISCKKEGSAWLCDKCLNKIIFKVNQTCPICNKIITPNGEACFSCQHQSAIDGILVASFYRKNKKKTVVAALIHFYKYRFVDTIGLSLGKILERSILRSTLPLPEIIIPVPLHHRRLRWRGFNQSQLLATYLGENLTPGFGIPVATDALLRNRYTKPQMEIKNRQKRELNTQDAFSFNGKKITSGEIRGKVIFLVDDIATTGSTLFECAKELKKTGAKKVYGIVLARQ